MEPRKYPRAAKKQGRKGALRMGLASGSMGSAGIALSLMAPAHALEPIQPSSVNNELGSRTEKLASLQAGARRAQLERLQRSQALLEHTGSTAPSADSVLTSGVRSTTSHQSLSTDQSLSTAQSASASIHQNVSNNGVYLYGEKPAYDQLNAAYFVFETNNSNVTGAFYTASSSFDCAQGLIHADRVQLTITNSYSQDSYSYALGLNPAETQVASQQPVTLPVEIDGFYQLPVRESDRAILATCQAQS